MAQITITLTVPDNKQLAVLNAFCNKYGYTEESGLTKVQFLKQEVAQFLKDPYIESVQTEQQRLAQIAISEEVNSFNIT